MLEQSQNHIEAVNSDIPSVDQVDQKEEKAPYWRSLEEWNQDPLYKELATTEFLSSPIRDGEPSKENALERRDFLKLMGASIALASGTGCIRRPVQRIVPYNKQPEEVVLGMPQFYTSTWVDGIEPLGLIVRTREGRPIKVEGNPDFPTNRGGLLPRAHAQLLALYDPDRLRAPRKHLFNKERTNFEFVSAEYEKLDDEVVSQLNKGGVALLTGELVGPAERALVQDFVQAFGARHFIWDPAAQDGLTEANRECFGEATLPLPRFDLAKLIISVDCDFLGTWMLPNSFQRQFADGRRDPAQMSRLVAFDSAFSLTGANADIRYKIKPSDQVLVVMGLAHELVIKRKLSRFATQPEVVRALAPYADAATRLGISEAQWRRLGDDLAANLGRALVVAGGAQTETAWSKSLFIAVNFLNAALESDGATLFPEAALLRSASLKSLIDLMAAIEGGEVKTLIIHRSNPLYSSTLGVRLVQALKQVEMVIYTGDRVDETARQAHLLVPDHHPMESWSDAEMVSGVVSIQQPTIRPLYNTRSFALSLMTWAYLADKGPKRILENETFYDYMRSVWRDSVYPRFRSQFASFDLFWDHLLQKGFAGSLPERGQRSRVFRVASLAGVVAPQSSLGMELVAYPSYSFHYGSLSNVSWLNELPDPVTRICWDHYAMVSLKKAQELKLKSGELIEISLDSKKFVLPAQIQPGLSDHTIAVALGYGRTHAGKVGSGIGVNLAGLLGEVGLNSLSGHAALLKKAKGYQRLASVQSHHVMEGRQLVVEATQVEYRQNPGANIKRHAVFSIWPGHKYDGHKWGMAVDLNVCTGCAACVVACQSENNIPVVGRKYVLQGREMHWMRLDRYYVGNPDDAEVVWQPVMCQQCDNAPCETVCPVLATVHNSEGLNDMVYNRCVGTRYCANNCPYKVRRFNWFHFTKNIQKPLHLALNPDVTVRTRGVMEKCTFCIQRIKNTKIQFRVEQRELKDGDIKTACQESCPTGAIVFGDLNDENSQVSKIVRSDARAYALLEEVNAAPNVRYLTKIRNNGESKRFQKKQKSDVEKGEHA